MTTVNDIKAAIESLSHKEFMQLMSWVHEKDMEQWNAQLAKDSAEGKLDFLIREASEEQEKGTLRKL